jgi:thioredoxin 1
MKKNIIEIIYLVVIILLSCSSKPESTKSVVQISGSVVADSSPMITFIELGSVNCIPCKMMQPVMTAIEKKYSEQIKIIFYDVWKDDQQQYAVQYGIRLIPTQVFLDSAGKEIMRHEGFFPELEIEKFLQSRGLIPRTKK